MGHKWWLIFTILTCLIACSSGRELHVKPKTDLAVYNHTLARILVEYASAVYMSDLTELFTWTCERCDGLTKGFEVIELVVDVQNCLQAFVGVAKDLNAIVIAFRGTQEHSQYVPNTFRVTNDHDIVPHLPPYYTYFPKKTYHHFPTEVWLYSVGLGSLVYKVEKVCDDSGEDPTCSRSVTGNSITDHLNYFGVDLMCEQWRSCRIVMEPSLAAYGTTDHKGNFILSRDPSTLAMKMNIQSNEGGDTFSA
ncbi:lipase-like protein [Corchorus capsularis]|uniref:Lipase-like protein n=1 Tax=Corchorus capsularis TaxID=210143 RepID=A0A1R3G6L9_COCAP|nr:lipase-like protein [Corchorus capsularis]